MPELTIETILGAARRAALAGGLAKLLRIHLRIGPDAAVSGPDLEVLLRDRWRGPLFDDCEMTWEESPEGGVLLASVEGISVEHA